MKLPSKDMQVLQHMLKYINRIETEIREHNIDEQAFKCSYLFRDAISMSLLQIGEKVKLLSKEFCQENKEIPWKEIAGMRDYCAHDYGRMNIDTLWDTASNDVPLLRMFCETKLIENGVPLPEPEPLVAPNEQAKGYDCGR